VASVLAVTDDRTITRTTRTSAATGNSLITKAPPHGGAFFFVRFF
jgi:hypothetical protein